MILQPLFPRLVPIVKAGRKSWTRFREKDGFYTYVLPVSALDRPLKIAAHSKKKNHWYQHVITFFSSGAKKLRQGAWAVTNVGGSGRSADGKTGNTGRRGRTSGTQTRFRNDGRRAKVSRYRDDASGSTSPVNSRTGLKDGVYTPERFSWSGGSGRLSWIRCDKVTVRGGNAYASIVFGSSSYDRLRANGRVYARSGGGNSTFVIPVSLNRNNTIIGRTTAMSQPHWIRYTIFVGKGVPKARSEKIAKKIRRETRENRQHFAKTAPEIPGLSYSSRVKTKKAAYFRIFRYSRGVSLIQMKLTRHTGLKNRYRDAGKKEKAIYDEEGRKEGKTLPEIMKDLYHHDVVNYLVVPERVTLPAGLEKDYIIKPVPLQRVFTDTALKHRTELQERNITLHTENLNVQVMTDSKWLGFIFGQLISNSIKYQASEITVSAADTPEQTVLHFRDNGIGIPPHDLPSIFEKSFTGENGRTHAKSTGMGLYIVKKLCEKLGHSISAESEQGNYTEIRIVFGKNDLYAGNLSKM